MNGFVNYMEENAVLLLLLFVALVGVIVLWCLYQTEKKREKHAAAKTAGEEQFYRAFAENEKEAFFFVSKGKQELLYVSPNFERLTGVSEELFRADLEVLRKLISTKKSREITRKMEQWNGTDRLEIEADYHRLGEEQMLRAKLELYNVENPSGYLLRMADITEEHRIRQEMYIDLQKAKRESQSKTDFLSQMSHEIRTPMNGILGMLSLMRMHLSDPKTAEEYLNRTENLSQFLLTLINDILDMSRIESGKMELVAEPFDLYELADKLDAMFRGTAEAKGIHWGIQMQDFDVHDVIGDEIYLSKEGAETALNAGAEEMTLTTQNAHAWAEVYVNGMGWLPVEVVPGMYVETYSNQKVEGAPSYQINPSKQDESYQADENAQSGVSGDGSETAETQTGTPVRVLAGIVIVLYMCLMGYLLLQLQRWIRIRLRTVKERKRVEQYGFVAEIVRENERLMRIGGIQGDFDYPFELEAELQEKLPALSIVLYERAVELVQKVQFGGVELAPYEKHSLEAFQEQLKLAVAATGKGKKLLCRYWYAI